jgi:Ca2+-binding RTX toxin-like protein
MANLTAREQLMLELTNRARMDPKGEAARLGVTLGAGQDKPVQVLAGNDALKASAYNHSGWMLLNDLFTGTEAKGSKSFIAASAFDRMKAYGYSVDGAYKWGENISWKGHTTSLDFTAAIAAQHETLFKSATSRGRILDAGFQEVGIGQQAGEFASGGKLYTTSMITQDFIKAGAKVFVTGVIYNDTKTNNDFYDFGEGTASRHVKAAGATTDTAGAGGGYELKFSATGIKTVTFDLASADLKLDVALGTANVKVDAVNGREIWTNASVQSQSAAIKELHALGVSELVLIGGNTSEKIVGNNAVNQLLGQGGNDRISGRGGVDTILGGTGNDSVTGGGGRDAFVFDAALGPTNIDRITDFAPGTDKLHLERAIFAALGATITASEFHVRARGHAADGSDHIIYDKSNGTLWYDADDNGAGAAIQFATLTNRPASLTVSDFLVV